MKLFPVLAVLSVIFSSNRVNGYSTGAPNSQCGSMTPGHDHPPLDNTVSPYSVLTDKTSLQTGEPLLIQIRTSGVNNFLGFLVQVRDSTDRPVGTFENPGPSGRLVTCSNPQDAVTHSNNVPKSGMQFTWKAPPEFSGTVKVLATVVVDYTHYYVKLPAPSLVQVVSSLVAPIVPLPPPVDPSPTPEPEPEPQHTSSPQPAAVSTSPAYAGCGKVKSCLGQPSKCESQGTCQFMFTWMKDGDKMVWEGYRTGSGYVGVGISEDNKMGNDVMFICTPETGVRQYGSQGKNIPNLSNPSRGLNLVKTESKDGDYYCKFESGLSLQSAGASLQVNLNSTQYFILVASGDIPLSYHGQDRIFSGNSILLSLVERVGSGNNNLLKVHGLCMVAAWIGCAGTGILMARYFKQTWKSKQVLGTAPWFLVHRSLMGLSVLLTAVGFILVLIHTEGWNYTPQFIRQNPHPALGLATVIMAFIQPVMAMFRPHPDTEYRYIFNWAHWFLGNSAFIIGIAAIFLAGDLAAVKIETTGFVACLVVYIVILVIVHLLMVGNNLWADRDARQTEVHPMTEKGTASPPTSEVDQQQDQPGGVVRKCLLLFFVLFSAAIVIALICLIFQFD